MAESADPVVLHKGFGLAAVRSHLFLGGDTGLAGRGPERGTTGTLTVSTIYIRRHAPNGKESLHRGHTRGGNGPFRKFLYAKSPAME